MTLTTRFSLFLLTTLALVLAGFSATLYLLAKGYLHRQSEERLEAALYTLVAAVEIKPGGVEWEPTQRPVNFGSATLVDQVVWWVSSDQAQVVDHSGKSTAEDFLAEARQTLQNDQRLMKRLNWEGERWLVCQRLVQSPVQKKTQASTKPRKPGKKANLFASLTITAGVPLEPMRAALRYLALSLLGISSTIWLLAFFAGRAMCRWSLLPVTRMALAARDMDTSDLCQRLPISATGDEVEDLGRAFNSLLDRRQESFERQRRFTHDASHQLRTPLAVILGQIEVALRRERPVEEYRQVLTTVHGKANHLQRIVESLLFLARAESESPLPGRERVNLTEWLPAYIHSLAGLPRAADVKLDIAGLNSAWIDVHPVLLGELLNILLDNAWKYSRPGSPIDVRLQRQADSLELSVQDRGVGIKDNDLPHIFSPFFRSTDILHLGVEGLGLGLSIAQRLTRGCGGTLFVKSQVGQGSCFTLQIPAAKQPEYAANKLPCEEKEAQRLATPTNIGGIRVGSLPSLSGKTGT